MSREQTPADGAPEGAEPAHSTAEIPYTTQRDAIPLPEADLTVDGTGLLCVTLLLRLRAQIDGAPPGTVVHVVATDPAAPLDLPAWCHMTGHTYLGPVPGERPVYALRLAADARATRRDAPWHLVGPEHTRDR